VTDRQLADLVRAIAHATEAISYAVAAVSPQSDDDSRSVNWSNNGDEVAAIHRIANQLEGKDDDG
jgi:hypothetical protein